MNSRAKTQSRKEEMLLRKLVDKACDAILDEMRTEVHEKPEAQISQTDVAQNLLLMDRQAPLDRLELDDDKAAP